MKLNLVEEPGVSAAATQTSTIRSGPVIQCASEFSRVERFGHGRVGVGWLILQSPDMIAMEVGQARPVV
jgi:hypothetical protein